MQVVTGWGGFLCPEKLSGGHGHSGRPGALTDKLWMCFWMGSIWCPVVPPRSSQSLEEAEESRSTGRLDYTDPSMLRGASGLPSVRPALPCQAQQHEPAEPVGSDF